MSFRGRDSSDGGGKLDEPRRYGSGLDDKSIDDPDDRRFDSGRGRRPPFGRGRRPSPPGRDRPRDFGYGRDEPSIRDRSPLRGPDDRFPDRYKKDDGPYPKRDEGRKDMGRPFYGDDPHRDRYMEGRSRLDGPVGGYNSRFDAPDPYKTRPSMNYPAVPPPAKGFFNEGFPKPNECEIIAVNKQQRAYAESVEARIKDLGILVDVLFLKDEALLAQTIDDIARRGSLYAMVISPQNETHGSVTVNILHGTPQEHRNMPLDDALKLLVRNFHEHVRLQREKMERERVERGPYIGTVTADREMQVLLRMLADGRWISVSEIDAVIRYLGERRDRMQGVPGEDRGIGRLPPSLPSSDIKRDIPPFKPKDDIDVAQKEQDLQNRIMNIMNQGAPTQPIGNSAASDLNSSTGGPPRIGSNINNMRPQPGMGPNIPGLKSNVPIRTTEEAISGGLESTAARGESVNQPVFTSTTAGTKAPSDTAATPTYINFNNPSVQKALDNLMQSGPILKNISLSGTNLSKPPPSLPENASKPPIGGQGPLGPPPNDPMGMQRGGMGPPRGPGGMADMPGSGQTRGGGNLDIGPPRGGGNLDMGPPRGSGNLDMGPPRGGCNLDMGPPRGGGNLDLGPPRGAGNLDMGPPRGAGNLDIGPHRGNPNMGGPGPQRGPGSDMMGMGQGSQRGGFGGISDMGGMNSNRSYGNTGMSDSGLDQQRMPDMGRMGGPHLGMGPGSNFPGQNQFGKYQGPGQQGSFPGSYNNPSNMGNMPRQNYGGGQGMGGMGNAPRRY